MGRSKGSSTQVPALYNTESRMRLYSVFTLSRHFKRSEGLSKHQMCDTPVAKNMHHFIASTFPSLIASSFILLAANLAFVFTSFSQCCLRNVLLNAHAKAFVARHVAW